MQESSDIVFNPDGPGTILGGAIGAGIGAYIGGRGGVYLAAGLGILFGLEAGAVVTISWIFFAVGTTVGASVLGTYGAELGTTYIDGPNYGVLDPAEIHEICDITDACPRGDSYEETNNVDMCTETE